MTFDQITIRNFKCFDDDGGTIDNLKSFNIIIGKNNSGKSSILEVMKYLTNLSGELAGATRQGKSCQLDFVHEITKERINESHPNHIRGGNGFYNNQIHREHGFRLIGQNLQYKIQNGSKNYISCDLQVFGDEIKYMENYVKKLYSPIYSKIFKQISAERDIKPEKVNGDFKIEIDGNGTTNYIRQILMSENFDSSMIEDLLLENLNSVLNPEIAFSRILVQYDINENWQIHFDNLNGDRVPLSKMGSGVKTVLLVLLYLIVVPRIEKKQLEDYVFAFEELENNLHPALQRRLFVFIFKYCTENKCITFLTTHSHIVLDLFTSSGDVKILHVVNNGTSSKIKSIDGYANCKKLLEDLDVRASDIMLSNGIIWVEGPSDRIYIKKWLGIVAPELEDGRHFVIMFYGGRLLSRVTFKYENINSELIPLLKLNTNAFVVIDRDAKRINQALNKTKKRIEDEIGKENAWITQGREIENYITSNTLKSWLRTKYSSRVDIAFSRFDKIEDSIRIAVGKKSMPYEKNKVKYAAEIVNYINIEELQTLDLKSKIEQLASTIKLWNQNSTDVANNILIPN